MNQGLFRMPRGAKARVSLGRQFGFTGRLAPNGIRWHNIPDWATQLEVVFENLGHTAAASDKYYIDLGYAATEMASSGYFSAMTLSNGGGNVITTELTAFLVADLGGSSNVANGTVKLRRMSGSQRERWVLDGVLIRGSGVAATLVSSGLFLGSPNRSRIRTLRVYAPTHSVDIGSVELFAIGDDI